jgi:hypothetical protein
MPRVAVAPSIIDDAGFLDELDKLEGHPEPPEVDVLSAYWDHAMRTDADDQQHLPALVPESPAIAPVVRSVRSAKTPRPLRLGQPLRLETPVRAHTPERTDAPFWPQAPAQPAARVQSDSSARSEHVDGTGESDAALTPESRRVSLSVAALMVVLCLGVGAGSAALVFHDRVAQIAVSWWK